MGTRRVITTLALTAGLLVLSDAPSLRAAEIRVLFPAGLKAVTDVLVPQFEQSTGHKVSLSYANIGTLTDRVRNKEAADMAVVSPRQWESLHKAYLFSADVRVRIAHVAVGAAVKKGANRPPLGSNDEVRKTLLSASSVGISNPEGGGTTGNAALVVFERLGITDEMKARTRVAMDTATLLRDVAKGEIEIGISPATFIVQSSAVDLAGVLPGNLQIYTEFVAGITTYAQQPDAARALVKFLRSPAAEPVFKAMGANPG
ncbi:MAG: substrate-binding domain-containing protein [Xanthobacteraceae bacterium]|nr:substrate-binding domain-containing protein [Xanthobacteraceae bacterium]